jgi:2'-5' RNA ligase
MKHNQVMSMEERRTFVAVPLQTNLKDRIAAWMKEKQTHVSFQKWTHREDLHITLHYLGNTSPAQLDQIKQALTEICTQQLKFHLALKGFGTFGVAEQPRILWIGIDGNQQLQQLQKKVTDGLDPVGFPAENRPYRPHITIARKYTNNDFKAKDLAPLGSIAESFVVDRIALYESVKGKEPVYRLMEQFLLT